VTSEKMPISSLRLAALCCLEACAAYSVRIGVPGLRPLAAPAVSARMDTLLAPEQSATAAGELNNTWYAVGFSDDINSDKPFGTRLFGEPVVLYRDAAGEATCVRDVCPHRSAPLSMGDVEDGQLRCFYHGWGFGAKGACESVPTGAPPNNLCVRSFAVAEHEGMLYVWRGNPLAADARKLPTNAAAAAAPLAVIDTTLDFGSEWADVAEHCVSQPHLHWLHDSTLPPPGTMLPQPLSVLPTRAESSTQTAATREAAHIVRHVGASGFDETMHVVPIGPERSRVLLRQVVPRENNALLAMVLQLPGMLALFTVLIQNWNFLVAESDKAVASKQQEAASEEGYFARWGGKVTSEYGQTSKFGQQRIDNQAVGTYGLKRSYVMDTPAAQFPPLVPTGQSSGIPLMPEMGSSAGVVERFQAAQQSLAAGILSVPAGFLTYKTVGPAVAALIDSQ